MAAEGASITMIIDEICLTAYYFHKARDTDPIFAKSFSEARAEGLEMRADELLDIANDLTIDVNRARLKSDNIKWILSKRKPGTYGDKLDLNVNQVVDIGTALQAAKSRLVSGVTTDYIDPKGLIDSVDNKDTIEIEAVESVEGELKGLGDIEDSEQ